MSSAGRDVCSCWLLDRVVVISLLERLTMILVLCMVLANTPERSGAYGANLNVCCSLMVTNSSLLLNICNRKLLA